MHLRNIHNFEYCFPVLKTSKLNILLHKAIGLLQNYDFGLSPWLSSKYWQKWFAKSVLWCCPLCKAKHQICLFVLTFASLKPEADFFVFPFLLCFWKSTHNTEQKILKVEGTFTSRFCQNMENFRQILKKILSQKNYYLSYLLIKCVCATEVLNTVLL